VCLHFRVVMPFLAIASFSDSRGCAWKCACSRTSSRPPQLTSFEDDA
jgi:hypothetical protein